jgi:hypothetical protein
MTTPPLDQAAPRGIPAIHAAIAAPAALHRERRALYQLASELLLEHCGPHDLDLDIIDSPLARHHIGDALAGRTRLSRSALVGISSVAGAGNGGLRVASRPQANTLLAPALETVRAELGRQQAACGSPELLTETDSERFTAALAMVHDGVSLARSVSPELIDDVLAHIALVGLVDPQHAGRLVSASPRAFPGLVLLKGPQSSVEVAEALVHEGAHQKFFDLAITHDMLNADSDRCPSFHPPWAPKKRLWPLEQALAACHAYACLTWFGHDLGIAARARRYGPESLLPVAGERCTILGEWLLDKGDHLGPDAHALLDGLVGRRPRGARVIKSRAGSVIADYFIDTPLTFRHCGSPDRVLVGRTSRPPQLYWLSGDAAKALELLADKPLDGIADTFAQRWGVQQFDAADRLTALFSDLYVSGLIKVRDTAGGAGAPP